MKIRSGVILFITAGFLTLFQNANSQTIEKENINEMYQRLVSVFKKIPYDYEIIYVDNCSKDGSEEIFNKLAKKGDTVGIFGKGHEKSMNLDGKNEIPWSDKEAVEKVLNGQ